MFAFGRGNLLADVEEKGEEIENSPISPGLLGGGCLGGAAVGLVGLIVGVGIGAEEGCYELGCGMPEGLIVGAIGCMLGTAIGVYIVGSWGNETGSFLATLGGSIIGGVVWIAIGREVSAVMTIPASTIGAIIGFNLTRRYKSPPDSKTALINFRDGQMSLAVPAIYPRLDSFDGRILTQRVDLVRVIF